MGTWLIFDDETVDSIKEGDIPKYFGDSNSGSAYVLYYQAVDVDLSGLGPRSTSPEPTTQPVPQPEPSQPLQPTDSPASTALSIPPLPPGLTDDVTSPISVPESLPRPTTPPMPPQSPLESAGKSPRKVPSRFFDFTLGRPATVGHAHPRNDSLLRPSRPALDEKFSPVTKPILSPIVISPNDDVKPLDSQPAGAVNGKEGNSDRSMLGWFRRRSVKGVKPRPSSEINTDIPPIPQDILAAPGSPVRNQSTSSSSNSSKDSRRPPDSPNPRPSPRLSPLPYGRHPSHYRADDTPLFGTHSRQSSASGVSHTTPISPASDQRSHIRPLPAIPASPQTPKSEIPSPLTRTSLDQGRVHRRPGVFSVRDLSPPLSPKSASRPATSAGSPTKTRPSPISVPPSHSLQASSPNTTSARSESKKGTVTERPKSAHASYGALLSPPTSPVPPLPVSVTGTTRKPAMRKLSLSSPMLGFVRRDKDKQ